MLPHEPSSAERLNARFGTSDAETVLAIALDRYDGKIAMVSSFGAEAAVLLHLLSRLDPTVPVILLNTLLLFPETLSYQKQLTAAFRLQDVRVITPDERPDPYRNLYKRDSLACCNLRKVTPLEQALDGFEAVITGRKRFQTRQRQQMERFEYDGLRLKINPLAHWTQSEILAYFERHALPKHPLSTQGYKSIGCAPCTSPVHEGEDQRAGRFRHEDRQECGIHFDLDASLNKKY